MRQRKIFYFTVLYFCLATLSLGAQQLFIWKTDDTKESFGLTTIKTLTFINGTLVLNSPSGTYIYNLSTLKKLTFDNTPNNQNSVPAINSKSDSFYYNRSENVIYLHNSVKYKMLITIFSVNGKLIYGTQLAPGSQIIDVSGLKQGIYIVKINNQAFKFIK